MRIELFYDVVSPYSRAAFTSLTRWAPIWQAELVLRPFFLAGALKATGNSPPALLPARGLYMARDIARLGAYFGIKLELPATFPTLTLNAMRVLTQVEEHAGAHLQAASEALFERFWDGRGQDVNDPAVLTAALLEAGIDEPSAVRFVAAASDPAVKARLVRSTEEAVERGAFGAPTYFVRAHDDDDEEMFFGSDRLPLMAHRFGKPYPSPVPQAPAQDPARG